MGHNEDPDLKLSSMGWFLMLIFGWPGLHLGFTLALIVHELRVIMFWFDCVCVMLQCVRKKGSMRAKHFLYFNNSRIYSDKFKPLVPIWGVDYVVVYSLFCFCFNWVLEVCVGSLSWCLGSFLLSQSSYYLNSKDFLSSNNVIDIKVFRA